VIRIVHRYIKIILSNIVAEAIVNDSNNSRGITLSKGGVLTRTRGMDMRSVALQIKAITQTGIQISNPPGFVDGHSGLLTFSGDKAVHATIEVGEEKAILLQESGNTRVCPISASPRPFNEHGDS